MADDKLGAVGVGVAGNDGKTGLNLMAVERATVLAGTAADGCFDSD